MKSARTWSLIPLMSIAISGISLADNQTDGIDFSPDPSLVERGRYITLVAGCNDCHTASYAIKEGNVPEAQWLTGDNFGWRGPWGTTYGSNLRLFVSAMTERQWVEIARTLRRRPPMPWFNLNAMSEEDLLALYHFMRSLGDPGSPTRTALPPDAEPDTAHAMWIEGSQ